MEKAEKKIDEQLQFWSVIGPFMTLLTVVVCLTKGSPVQSAYSIVGLMGIPLCLRWKKQGMLLSLVLLAAVFVYQMSALSLDQQIWSGGLFVSFALSFFVTALSLEEGSHIVTSILADSQSRLGQVMDLDEKMKGIETELEIERKAWGAKVSALEADSAQLKEKLDRSQTLVDAAQQELTSIYEQNKSLLEEIFEMRSRPAPVTIAPEELDILRKKVEQEEERTLMLEMQLEEKVAIASKQTESLELLNRKLIEVQEEHQQRLQEMKGYVAAEEAKRLEELSTLQEQLTAFISVEDSYKRQLNEKEEALQQLSVQYEIKGEEVVRQHAAFTQELTQLRAENEELKEKQEKAVTSASKKETAAYRKLQGMFKQLKEQFEEKCEILDETRRAQFHMQERLFQAQRELEEKQRNDKNEAELALEAHLKKMEEERVQLEKEYTSEIEDLQQIIASLSSKK